MIAAMLLSVIPYSPVIETDCDVYEVNRIYNDEGGVVLTQRIAWDLPDVLGWRMWKRPDVPVRGGVLFLDGNDSPVMRRLRFLSKVQSNTNYDPEMEQRDLLPDAERRGLGDKP